MGHALAERDGYSGEVAGIIRSAESWIAVADPRSGGGSAGY
jgi:gamma-glutamyltranspeptidase